MYVLLIQLLTVENDMHWNLKHKNTIVFQDSDILLINEMNESKQFSNNFIIELEFEKYSFDNICLYL